MNLRILLYCLIVVLSCPLAHGLPVYHVTPLDMPGNGWSQAFAISDSGIAVGETFPVWTAFSWTAAQGMSFLPVNAGYFSQDAHGMAVNDGGTVAGHVGRQEGPRAVIWNADGMVDLGLPQSYAFGINNSGSVVGRSGHFGFLWRSGSEPIYLPYSELRDINDSGAMVGRSHLDGRTQATLWDSEGAPTEIGGLDGAVESGAVAINESGQVLGLSSFASGPGPTTRAFLWSKSAGFTEIPVLLNAYGVEAAGLSDSGVVVGSLLRPERPYAFAYTPESGTVELDSLLDPESQDWTLYRAYGVNDCGQIVGYGVNPKLGGDIHAYLLTPVPEPSSLLALLAGVTGLGGLVSLRRKK